MWCLPSSLTSLAQGRGVFAPGEVLASWGGILAPVHDGFFAVFATDERASFDEAEPMEVEWFDLGGTGPRKRGGLSHV